MIFLYLLISLQDATLDSLNHRLEEQPQLSHALALNRHYLARGEFNEGIKVLTECQERAAREDRPGYRYMLAEDYFYAGEIVQAREAYRSLVAEFPSSNLANDGLERLSLIESTRNDTTALKKLSYALCLSYTEQLPAAEDSLKNLLTTPVGVYAYYALALVYRQKGDAALALSALQEMDRSFPDHTLYQTALLLAELYVQLNNQKQAQTVLEDIIVKQPASIYAVQARQMLERIQKRR
jgi:predicted Zn-dependent protease